MPCRRRIFASGPLLLVTACSSQPQPLDTRTCDQPGPAQILSLPPLAGARVLVETGGRWVVQTGTLGSHQATTVGPCGENPKALPEAGDIAVDDSGVWIVQRAPLRVGHWPVEGGEVAWISEGEPALGLAAGRGYVVLERASETDVSGTAVLVGIDGTRQPLWADVAAYDLEVETSYDGDALTERFYRFQAAAGVVAYLDGVGVLRVAHLDDPSVVHTVDNVASFALGPDGSWFVTREDDGSAPDVTGVSPALFHVRGAVDVVALGEIEVSPVIVDPSGWFALHRGDGPISSVFVPAMRTELAMPDGFPGPIRADEAGGLYAVIDGSVQRWDPFTDAIESKASVPSDFVLRQVKERAALGARSTGPFPSAETEAEVTVAPFDGGEPWRVPDLVDVMMLLPDGSVVYTPDVDESAEVAPLLWVDREGEPREIDPAVPITWSGVALFEGDLVFTVEDGDRTGLWRAALP